VVGVLTSFFAATVGLVQNDIKKIIAYSTCSQLGYMFFICGLSQYNIGLFHLSNHAFFKALLFLGAGSVIHSMGNEQDIRKMGGLVNFMPVTYTTMFIASLSLAGFPFLSGFYSKDTILETALVVYGSFALFAYWLGVLTAFFTGFYSFRLLFLVFLTRTNAYKRVISNVHESPNIILILLVLLSLASIFIGYLSRDFFIGCGSISFLDAICILPEHIYCLDIEFLPLAYKNIPVVFSSLGILLSYLIFNLSNMDFVYYKLWRSTLYMDFLKFFTQKWYFDYIYNSIIGYPILKASYSIFFKLLDKGIVEILGPKGICWCVYQAFLKFRAGESGYIYQYTCILGFFYIATFVFINL
jgi:NADH-ubiquinone oxidoreductase chain 5